MKLDKRIKDLTDIQSVTDGCHDWEFMTKKGYFANRIFDFKELKRFCAYGEYAGWREHNQCFLCEQAGDETYYSYFLPEDSLLSEEPEKKYKPYSNELWTQYYDIGDIIHFRRKGNAIEHHMMFTGYTTEDGTDMTAYGIGAIILGGNQYSFQTLFESYEIMIDDNWQPFGVIDEEGAGE